MKHLRDEVLSILAEYACWMAGVVTEDGLFCGFDEPGPMPVRREREYVQPPLYLEVWNGLRVLAEMDASSELWAGAFMETEFLHLSLHPDL
jgi:hypothetical protein